MLPIRSVPIEEIYRAVQASLAAPATSGESVDSRVEAVKRKSIYVRCSVEGCDKKMLKDAPRICDCKRIVCSRHQFAHGCLFVPERKLDESDRPQKRQYAESGGRGASSDLAF